jgi:UDP-N-acetyl-D-mannosaminuronic acid transferase (WecB/TagA/CpsF family)
MNEKLRQFEKESKLEIFGLGARREVWEKALEKFAELIVKEMLVTCEEHPAWTGRIIGEQIKQHFGVEE